MRRRGFTFNFSIAHCGGDGRKRKKKGMKGRKEPNSCLETENSSNTRTCTRTQTVQTDLLHNLLFKQADESKTGLMLAQSG